MTAVDWSVLRAQARTMTECSYAPYSGLQVGAAGITTRGELVVGCNIESASFGVTLCAECGLVSDLHRLRASRLVALSVVDPDGANLWPCGRCRQLLIEVAGPDLLIDAADGPLALGELLPNAFVSDHLP